MAIYVLYFFDYLPAHTHLRLLNVPEQKYKHAYLLTRLSLLTTTTDTQISYPHRLFTMTTVPGMAFGETPERVLKRVQQLEDVELPSLPSFSHDMDYDSEVDQTEDERSLEMQAEKSEAVSPLT